MALNRITNLVDLNSSLSNVNEVKKGLFGGRKFVVNGETVSLNEIVKKIEELTRSNKNQTLVTTAVENVVRLDAIKDKRTLTKIKHSFVNVFFNRDNKLAGLLQEAYQTSGSTEGSGYGKYRLAEMKEEAGT